MTLYDELVWRGLVYDATESTREPRECSHLSKVGELAEQAESERRTENTNNRAVLANGHWIAERPFKIRPRGNDQ